MNRAALLKRVLLDLDATGPRLDRALTALIEAKAGPRGSRFDPDQTTRESRYDIDELGMRIPIATASDPTGDAAVARLSDDLSRVDPALVDLRALDAALRHLESASRSVRSLVTKWATVDPTLSEDPGCEIVGSVTGAFEPTHRRGFDHGGELPIRLRVGRWSYDFIRRLDRLPTEEEIRAHVAGDRVR